MTDRELLEYAAKAAGISVVRSRLHDRLQNDMLVQKSARNKGQINGSWNPLTDDGDALRLAVKLRISLDIDPCSTGASDSPTTKFGHHEAHGPDPYAATRRAIVCAAAEIGRAMP